jgi:uncharacterized paraquat-inducible protein A
MSGSPTVIYHAASAQQAHILKGVLEERGIASWVVNDNIQVAGGELPIGWTAAACVAVGSLDAAEARQVAEEFDRTTAHEPTPDVPAAPAPQEWQDWPVCPQCQARRQVQCSICGSSGTDFPLADVIESGGESIVLLICSSCDDHFRPEMFRLCPRCGHDFGDGISFESASQPLDSSPRTWVVLGVMLAGAAILAAYFYALWG